MSRNARILSAIAAAALLVAIGLAAYANLTGGSGADSPELPAAARRGPAVAAGKLAADFTLKDLNGRTVSLSALRGKVVFLNIWATWCGPCRDEMPLLDHARSQYPGLEVVGVAVDDAGAVQRYLKDSPVRYPILVADDAPPSPALLYGDTRDVLPYSVLIGPDGTLLAQRAGSFTAESLGAWLKAPQ